MASVPSPVLAPTTTTRAPGAGGAGGADGVAGAGAFCVEGVCIMVGRTEKGPDRLQGTRGWPPKLASPAPFRSSGPFGRDRRGRRRQPAEPSGAGTDEQEPAPPPQHRRAASGPAADDAVD